jgi:predicted permease
MVDVALSLLPVFTLIALGAILRRAELLKAEQWAGIERLTYYVLFPPLLFTSIIGGAFVGDDALLLAIGLVATVAIMAGFMLLIRPVLPIPGDQFVSVFQAGVRWNGYVALGVISSLNGPPGVALSAVGFAALAPLTNVMGLLVAARYGGAEPKKADRLLLQLLANPLVLAAACACVAIAFGVRPTEPLARTLGLLGDATISLGLICVGAALDFSSTKVAKLALAVGTVLRLWVMPAMAAGLCILLGLSGMALTVAVVCAAAPATAAYGAWRQPGGDAHLMNNLITVTTLASLLTIPATILLVQALTR